MIYHTREEHPNHYTTDAFFRQRYNNENCIQLIKHVLYYPCITQLSFDALIIDAKIIPCIIDEIPVCDFLFMKAHWNLHDRKLSVKILFNSLTL